MHDASPRMGILMGAGIYVATFLVWSAIGSGHNLDLVPLIVYAVSGIFLSKVVLRRMIPQQFGWGRQAADVPVLADRLSGDLPVPDDRQGFEVAAVPRKV